MRNKNKSKIAPLLIILAACGIIGGFLFDFNKARAENNSVSESAAAGEFIVKLNKSWNSSEENTGKIKNLFKKFEGNRKVRLKKSVVNDLIESFLSTIKFIFGGDTTVIEKRELKKLQDRYDEISGQKISKKNIIHYKEIVKRREELKKEGKEGHQISWLKVTQEYRKSNKKILDWGDRKTKTISESIRKLHKAGKI